MYARDPATEDCPRYQDGGWNSHLHAFTPPRGYRFLCSAVKSPGREGWGRPSSNGRTFGGSPGLAHPLPSLSSVAEKPNSLVSSPTPSAEPLRGFTRPSQGSDTAEKGKVPLQSLQRSPITGGNTVHLRKDFPALCPGITQHGDDCPRTFLSPRSTFQV